MVTGSGLSDLVMERSTTVPGTDWLPEIIVGPGIIAVTNVTVIMTAVSNSTVAYPFLKLFKDFIPYTHR